MKLFLAILILSFITLAKSEESMECTLGVRVYPLKYVGATMTIEFKLGFKSSCSDFDSYNFFVLPYNVDYKLNRFKHPKQVVLQLFDKVYQFSFSKPRPYGRNKFFNIFYRSVHLRPSKSNIPINTLAPNNLILETNEVNLFSKDNIDTLYYKNNPCVCELSGSLKTMFCKIN